jgi:cell wall-associated NlpC family hydrolase
LKLQARSAAADTSNVRPFALTICLLVAAFAPASAGAAASPTAWANASIGTVLAKGALPGTTLATYQPEEVLDASTLQQLVSVVRPPLVPPAPPAVPTAPITLSALDTALVKALGLQPDAQALQRALVDAGLEPKPGTGLQITARQLGLTYDHADDTQELFPWEHATRADAAWATAHALKAKGALAAQVHATLTDLDGYLASQVGVAWPGWLVQAVGFVGDPYVWAGEWEDTDGPIDEQDHGGFDCSGLLYRVLVLEPGLLTEKQLGGRTTYQMARATPAAERLTIDALQPGDIVMFGDARGPASPPGAVGHVGLSLGGEWFVHSSGQGVTIDRLAGWYGSRFAWGRRPPVPVS